VNQFFRRYFAVGGGISAIVLVVCLGAMLTGATATRAADDLEDLLQQVGEEYAVAYSSPFLYAFAPAMNSGLYQTAAIPHTGLTFGISVKAMAAQIDAGDQTFRRVMDVDDLGVFDPAYSGTPGTVVMSGPTIFGDTDTEGTITGYVDGIPVFEESGITGLVDTKLVPMAAPEFYLGGMAGVKIIVRWLPEIDVSDYGKFKYLGYGVQWNTGTVLKNLPFDAMVGFSKQKLEVGSLLETNATAFFAAVSRDYSLLTLYGGAAIESSDMTVSYTYTDTGDEISFSRDGIQESRLTIGATLNLVHSQAYELWCSGPERRGKLWAAKEGCHGKEVCRSPHGRGTGNAVEHCKEVERIVSESAASASAAEGRCRRSELDRQEDCRGVFVSHEDS